MAEVLPAAVIKQNLGHVLDQINRVCQKLGRTSIPRLVAVGKTFPASQTKACYEAGQRHFGENYVQELTEKGKELAEVCPEIEWHFIGRVQTNKIKSIVETPGISFIETLDSQKHAETFQKYCESLNKTLKVFVQVNTSGESEKGGVEPKEVIAFVDFLHKNCPKLTFKESSRNDANNDFSLLVKIRKSICDTFKIPEDQVELSMGMSSDFPLAIEYGSTNVRVGSTIFGGRYYPNRS